MKIILTYPEMSPVAEEIIIEWIELQRQRINPEEYTPLKYAVKMEVER